MELNELKTDGDARESGVWMDYGEARFLIVGFSSERYKKALQKEARRHSPHKLKKDFALAETVATEAMAKACLVDFEGVTQDGVPLENTLENRRAILAHEPVREWIAEQAGDYANYLANQEEEEVEELKKP